MLNFVSCQVDFDAPVGYKEPTRMEPKKVESDDPMDAIPEPSGFQAFAGSGKRC